MVNCPSCGNAALSPALILGLSFAVPEPRCPTCGAYLEIGRWPLTAQALIGCSPLAAIASFVLSSVATLVIYAFATSAICILALRRPEVRVVPLAIRVHRAKWLAFGFIIFVAVAIANGFAF